MTGARILMTVDDAGDFLLCLGSEVTIGHARGGTADLPVLADVGLVHARFVRRTTLAGGAEWHVVPSAGERVSRNAEPLEGESPLADGDELLLGSNLRLVFREPDPASATALFDLQGGLDCLGAAHVVLFAPGPGGRLRVGARGGRHVRVPGLDPGFELVRDEARLSVTCAAGVAVAGAARATEVVLPFPPDRRLDVLVGAPLPGGRPPFSFSLAPVE